MNVNFAFISSVNSRTCLSMKQSTEPMKDEGIKCYRCNYQLIEESCKLVCDNCEHSLDCSEM
jgi:hypothetical protein